MGSPPYNPAALYFPNTAITALPLPDAAFLDALATAQAFWLTRRIRGKVVCTAALFMDLFDLGPDFIEMRLDAIGTKSQGRRNRFALFTATFAKRHKKPTL